MSSSSEADRVRLRAAALALDGGARDKPDAKKDVFADLGSPVSPLRPRATPSSSSSSAGSGSGPLIFSGGSGSSGDGGGGGSTAIGCLACYCCICATS